MAEDDEDTLFTVELQGIERETVFGEFETYAITFDCERVNCWVEVRLVIDVGAVTTLDLMPRAMADLRRAFAALAEQSAGWGPADPRDVSG